MESSFQLASILGPILIALSISEYKNFEIWRDIQPPVVYLNGLVLLSGGIIVITIHNTWRFDWTVLITVLGWLLFLLGLYRMISPTGKQVEKSLAANVIFLIMFILGIFLSAKAYILR